jgi:hypothetical protein
MKVGLDYFKIFEVESRVQLTSKKVTYGMHTIPKLLSWMNVRYTRMCFFFPLPFYFIANKAPRTFGVVW